MDGNNVIHSASWTRGDGVTIFDISNADNPRYAAGFLSAGYAFDMLEHNDYYYIATCYSIFIIRKKDNVMVENLLISFPEGKVTQLAIAGNILYCSSPDGLREYDILDNGRLMFRTVRTELIDLAAMAASGDIVYLVKKTEPQKILKINAKDGKVQTAFENFNTKIQSIIAVSGKVYAVCGKHLLDQDGKILLPHVDMTAAYAAGKDKIMVMGKENNAGKTSAKMIYLLNGADGGIIRKIEAGDIESRSFTTDGERLVWHSSSGIKVASLDDLQQQIDIPVIRNESAIVVVPPYVYSFDRGGGSEGIMRLYGFDLRKKQDLQKQVFDINLTWEYTKDQPGFYYDIVLQPFDYLKVDNKYLFVPGALLDISDPGKPELLDTSLALASTYAINEKKQIFLTQGSKLTVLDGTKLPEIKIIAQIPADKSEKKAMWSDVVVEGDYLYSNERTKLVVYHVADITNPKKVATLVYPEKSNVYKTIKVGQYLYCPGYSFWDDS